MIGDPNEGITTGEVSRRLDQIVAEMANFRAEVSQRHHSLIDKINAAIGPVSIHGKQIEMFEKVLERQATAINEVTAQANKIAGIGATIAVAVGWLSGWIRGHS